ncbi:hypothetical protein DID88_003901 [Monilinia fructigena]|uniref:SBE2/SBE22 middle domain-containing protein n=1 Tax=Monilinia fructigena TaxID=38457 RepID=A0A395ITM7_9HELO|nr:hypothetical protein DID88_003901 [Monilinia fructigena]
MMKFFPMFNHFEEIGLDDESRIDSEIGDFAVKMSTNPYSSTFTTDLRSQAKQQRQPRLPMSATQGNIRIPRDLTSTAKARPGLSNIEVTDKECRPLMAWQLSLCLERTSAAPSASTSPERPAKEKVKPLGNGTSAKPAEQGELRSPRPNLTRGILSEEAKALTEALEAHAEDEERREPGSYNYLRSATTKPTRVKSSFAELPPLRRTELMIDPLPISKEKEAVLSRTRPSWLPPKDPAEERRHLKEYQKMMASAEKVERKRESEKHSKSTCRDDTSKLTPENLGRTCFAQLG